MDIEYVGAEWSSDKITRNPFLILCSVNLTDCAIAAETITKTKSIAEKAFCLVIFIYGVTGINLNLLFGFHPSDAVKEVLMHHFLRGVGAPSMARQNPLKSEIQEEFHRF